jgi:hypothetical protein
MEMFMPIRLAILVLLCLIPACGRIPEPINHEYSQQKKMQAVEHWELLARDVASRLNHELVIYDYLSTPVFVKETCGDEGAPCRQNQTSSFNEAFRDLLITQLVQYGVQTRNQPANDALELNYKVQIVHHRDNRIRSHYPGTVTALTAAVLVLRDAPFELAALAAAGAADVANSAYTRHGHYEILITTSIVNANKYVFRTSDIYYINDKDFWHYQENPAEAGTISLTAPGPEPQAASIMTGHAAAQPPAQVPATPKPAIPPEEETVIQPPPEERTVIEPPPLRGTAPAPDQSETDI